MILSAFTLTCIQRKNWGWGESHHKNNRKNESVVANVIALRIKEEIHLSPESKIGVLMN